MIKNPRLLEQLHRRHDEKRWAQLSFEDGLQIFAALWAEARALGADGRRDWRTEIEPALAIARTLNGLPS